MSESGFTRFEDLQDTVATVETPLMVSLQNTEQNNMPHYRILHKHRPKHRSRLTRQKQYRISFPIYFHFTKIIIFGGKMGMKALIIQISFTKNQRNLWFRKK